MCASLMRLPILRALLTVAAAFFLSARAAFAHDEPTSFLDLRIGADGIEAVLVGSATDFAHDLPQVEPRMLLRPEKLQEQQAAIARNVLARLRIIADGAALTGTLRTAEPMPEEEDLRLTFDFPFAAPPARLALEVRLFPYDPRHQTFANVYRGGQLQRQEIFEGERTTVEFHPGESQSTASIFGNFLYEGIHHIFIGPDHILFIIGLLLLGGTLKQLIKIVTAFTIAHSVTLGLATFRIVTPPAEIIEPLIAISIVFVGVHALLGRKSRDPRMLFAFGFGLIHGFGFANVLAEMDLPRHALGWSLFAFNAGVEIGQVCIVAVVAPLLALVRRRSEVAGGRLVAALAYAVVLAGGFWFFERVLS
jgi:hydrogenase/urease accessory protein HupE